MGAPMKGLTQFIADLRNARAQEDEDKRINAELVNIQKQFLTPNLSGYQRKKYVCKLIYIYVLGHNLSFGYMEAIQLLSSKIYSEKEIGYLAVSILLNENHEMMTLVINSVKNDLSVDNYDFNCLALQVIATVGNEEWSQILAENVFQLVRSPATPPYVRKKATLALLKLIKVNPTVLLKYQSSWLPRIIALVDQAENDIGLLLSTVSLISYIGKKNPESIRVCIPIIIKILSKLVIERDCPESYLYYGIPDPWLTVKLLNLVEDLILIPNIESGYSSLSVSNIDVNNLSKLRQVVAKAIENGRRKAANLQLLNAQSAILFSAVSLATRLDPSPDAISGAIDALSQLLASKETNTRYLALNALIKIVSGPSLHIDGAILRNDNTAKSDDLNIHNSIKKHTDVILKLLSDKDVSVRQKSLDVLFLVCDFQNIGSIIDDLLRYLENSDYLIKSRISLKIYQLVEKFSHDLTWYVVNSLKIISISNNYSHETIWVSFVKVVVNSINNNLKTFACKSVYKHLSNEPGNEAIIKIAAFLLGEYGHLINSHQQQNEFSAWNQFTTLYDRYFNTGLRARYMILNTFAKFYIKFPELRLSISRFYRQELNSINTEIQQRSVEYIKLLSRGDSLELAHVVVLEMPEFSVENKDYILNRLEKNGASNSSINIDLLQLDDEPTTHQHLKPNITGGASGLLSPNFNDTSFNPFEDSDNESRIYSDNNDLLGSGNNQTISKKPSFATAAKIVLSPNWEIGYYRLLTTNENIFFENSLIKIMMKLNFDELKTSKKIRINIGFVNKSPADISSFITDIRMPKTTNPPVVIKNISLPDSSIPRNGKTALVLEAVIRAPFENSDAPILEINFLSGAFTTLKLRLPVILLRSLTPTVLSNEHFQMRWAQVINANNPALGKSIYLKLSGCNRIFAKVDNVRKYLIRNNWGECVDNPNANILLFAGIVHTLTAGNFGTLLLIEYFDNMDEFRITVRSTKEGIPDIIMNTLVSLFTH